MLTTLILSTSLVVIVGCDKKKSTLEPQTPIAEIKIQDSGVDSFNNKFKLGESIKINVTGGVPPYKYTYNDDVHSNTHNTDYFAEKPEKLCFDTENEKYDLLDSWPNVAVNCKTGELTTTTYNSFSIKVTDSQGRVNSKKFSANTESALYYLKPNLRFGKNGLLRLEDDIYHAELFLPLENGFLRASIDFYQSRITFYKLNLGGRPDKKWGTNGKIEISETENSKCDDINVVKTESIEEHMYYFSSGANCEILNIRTFKLDKKGINLTSNFKIEVGQFEGYSSHSPQVIDFDKSGNIVVSLTPSNNNKYEHKSKYAKYDRKGELVKKFGNGGVVELPILRHKVKAVDSNFYILGTQNSNVVIMAFDDSGKLISDEICGAPQCILGGGTSGVYVIDFIPAYYRTNVFHYDKGLIYITLKGKMISVLSQFRSDVDRSPVTINMGSRILPRGERPKTTHFMNSNSVVKIGYQYDLSSPIALILDGELMSINAVREYSTEDSFGYLEPLAPELPRINSYVYGSYKFKIESIVLFHNNKLYVRGLSSIYSFQFWNRHQF